MADEDTARTLVLVGAILQLLIAIGLFLAGGLFMVLLLIAIGFEPEALIAMFIPGVLIVMAIVSLILSVLWFSWRSNPTGHKTGLIVTGILGLILGGVLPGLLVLIGGIVSPSEI